MSPDRVALRVVTFLGSATILGLLGVIALVYTSIGYDELDASTVPLVSGVSTLVGIALGALASMLSTTGKSGPQPVTVENKPTEPLPVVEAETPAPSAFAVGDPAAPLKES